MSRCLTGTLTQKKAAAQYESRRCGQYVSVSWLLFSRSAVKFHILYVPLLTVAALHNSN